MTEEGRARRPDGSALPVPLKFTPEAQEKFLAHYGATFRKHESARVAGVDPTTIDAHVRKHPEFQDRVDAAAARYREIVEAEVHRRGIEGWVEPRFDKDGNEVGGVRKFSDKLLVMQARRCQKEYRENVVIDAKLTGHVDIVDLASLPEEARKKLRDVAVALARDRLAAVNGAVTNGTAPLAEDDGDEQS